MWHERLSFMARAGVLSSFVHNVLFPKASELDKPAADEMVMITQPFLLVCLIINSIMDSFLAWSPIRQS